MSRVSPDQVSVAILAKAPVPGYAKTRLIPALGVHGTAILQERLTEHAAATACAAGLGPVVIWCSPDCTHPSFAALAANQPLTLAVQPDGDLGRRMLTAIERAGGPVLVIGTDCPALTPAHLCAAAEALRGSDVVVAPAEDGGYVLIGMARPHPALFSAMTWGGATVMAETRLRIARAGLSCRELSVLWDVDRPSDLERLEREGFASLLA